MKNLKTILIYSLALIVGYFVGFVFFYLTKGTGETSFTEPIPGLIGGLIGLLVGRKLEKSKK